MKKRLTILGVAVGALIALVVVLQVFRGRIADANMGELEHRLAGGDPEARRAAAAMILRVRPDHPEALMVSAEGLLDLGKREDARRILEGMTARADAPGFRRAVMLLTRTYLDEAADQVYTGDVDLALERAEPLIDQALEVRGRVKDDEGGDMLLIEARAMDLRATLLERRLRARSLELAKARAVNYEQQVESLAQAVDETATLITAEDIKLAAVCLRANQAAPEDPYAYLYNFRRFLRAGNTAEARAVAGRLLGLKIIDRAVAGEVAHTLLSIESIYARPVTPQDISVAHALLSSPALSRTPSLWHRLAETELALEEHRPADAERLARAILGDPESQGHPRATNLLARAMIDQNRASEAVAFMTRFNDRVLTSDGLMMQGMAHLADGDNNRAREVLRQSLDLDPQNLPARLAMIQSMVERNAVLEADQDILIAQKISPDHPRVVAFCARLFIEKLDRRSLLKLLAPVVTPQAVTPRDVRLAALMALDDRAALEPVVAARLGGKASDVLAIFADAWLRCGARRRWETAFLINHCLFDALTSDPLRLAHAPVSPAPLDPSLLPVITPESDAPMVPSEVDARYFVPSLPQAALAVTEVAVDRWPGERPALLPVMIELALWSGRDEAARRLLSEVSPPPAEGTLLAAVRDYLGGSTPTSLDGLPASPTRYWLQLAVALRSSDSDRPLLRLTSLITAHSWAEPALLMFMRTELERDDVVGAKLAIEATQKLNPEMARLATGRLNLAQRYPREAMEEADVVGHDEAADSEVRIQAAEIAARAYLLVGQSEMATFAFDSLSYSMPDRKLDMRMHALDILILSRKTATASASSLAVEAQNARAVLDRVLVRAATIMPPQRLNVLIDNILLYQPNEPILWLHQANAQVASGELGRARRLLERLRQVVPDAPRIAELARSIEHAQTQPATRRSDTAPPPAQPPRPGDPPPPATQPSETGGGE
ncbi:MAG: hypothetical protein K8S99_03205 [Planctomycetes bacterium]|nr:hypothetical protein [Planctomycetota bacterium]